MKLSESISSLNALNVLQLACLAIFLGRGYQHLFWDGPYRSIFWDEAFFSGFAQNALGLSWAEFAESTLWDRRIQWLIKCIGVVFVSAGVASALYNGRQKALKTLLNFGIFFLAILAAVSFKSKFFQVAEGFEFGIQLFSPIALVAFWRTQQASTKLIFWANIAIAITFVGHGLYAFGVFPQPGYFIDMTITILKLPEDYARLFLKIMGVADFIAAALLFIPRFRNPALIYCVIWGLLTAMARIVAGFNLDFPLQTIHQWGFETVFRLAHGLLPLWVYLTLNNKQ